MTGRKLSAFQLSESERELRISEHRFYIEQAKSRLLSQFVSIEAEAERAEQEHWERSGEFFNPEWHDPNDFAEAARDHGIEFYQLLSDMHDRTRLSVVAGMYHHWDKTFRRFLVREFKWPGLVIGDNTRRALWKLDCAKLEQLLASLGSDVRRFASYPRMNAMRLVVNVFKHGEGKSLDDLRQHYPEFLHESSRRWGNYDDTDMVVTDEHVDEFSAAVESFWRELPPTLTVVVDGNLDLPDEFEKAWNMDLASQRTSRAPC
jgi:hypothetical protein